MVLVALNNRSVSSATWSAGDVNARLESDVKAALEDQEDFPTV